MRAIWKGHIRFSLVTIPVRIYTAIDAAKTISFNQLNKETNSPIKYEKKDKSTGEVVPPENIVKGYQYEPGQYVVIDPEDIEKVKIRSTKIIEIEAFVNASEVHPTLYDTPYFAGPDGEIAIKAYSLLCETLKETGKLGVGKVVIRDRESPVLLSPQENGLVMYKLRYPEDVRAVKNIPDLSTEAVDADQLKLSRTLVESMSKSLAEVEFKDKYREALKEMIQAKIEGKEIITIAEEETPTIDIMTALKASIEQAKDQKKPMKPAGRDGKAEDEDTTVKKTRKQA
ncbi:MAG: non-homologous end joining protein Ku [Cyclobacteriaceae bacterium]|nr:MAG: non-homologous end joining protein Ku [Cyclobacteriaceae bacterium]